MDSNKLKYNLLEFMKKIPGYVNEKKGIKRKKDVTALIDGGGLL